MQVPCEWPITQKFDLILWSEVLYFLTPEDIAQAATLSCSSLLPEGVILLVNYTEEIDEPCNGNEATEIFIRSAGKNAVLTKTVKYEKFRIDILKKYAAIGNKNNVI